MDPKYVYSVMDCYNNTNIIAIYEEKGAAIECAKKAFRDDSTSPPSEKTYQVNRIELNCLSYPSETFDCVWFIDQDGGEDAGEGP